MFVSDSNLFTKNRTRVKPRFFLIRLSASKNHQTKYACWTTIRLVTSSLWRKHHEKQWSLEMMSTKYLAFLSRITDYRITDHIVQSHNLQAIHEKQGIYTRQKNPFVYTRILYFGESQWTIIEFLHINSEHLVKNILLFWRMAWVWLRFVKHFMLFSNWIGFITRELSLYLKKKCEEPLQTLFLLPFNSPLLSNYHQIEQGILFVGLSS